MASESTDLQDLQNEWKEMFQHKLPEAATSKSSSQPKWPVHVDHCFARIILDAIVGIDTPWTQKVKSPAYKNMSPQQLQESIELGQKILDGEVDLVALDSKSLELRGKGKGMSGKASGKLSKNSTAVGKRKSKDRDDEAKDVENQVKRSKRESPEPAEEEAKEKSPYFEFKTAKASKNDEEDNSKPRESSQKTGKENGSKTTSSPPNPTTASEDLKPYLSKIALSSKTPFQKLVLTTLCQVPKGKYTTYGALSSHLSSSPRAVGNALRNNPFAPQVPCHRVLASGGGLGGFKGSWGKGGEQGLHDGLKRKLLREEGVRFDGKGRVVGMPWTGFV